MSNESYILGEGDTTIFLAQGQCISWYSGDLLLVSFEVPGQGVQKQGASDGFCAPLSGDYTFSIDTGPCTGTPSGTIIVDCSEIPGPAVVSPEKITVCDLSTGTLHVKTCIFTILDGEISEELFSDVDTGVPCGESLPVYDIESFDYCNLTTNTKWTQWFRFVTKDGVTSQEVINEQDTGYPCVEPTIIETKFCKKV